jgi:hypothetical protein
MGSDGSGLIMFTILSHIYLIAIIIFQVDLVEDIAVDYLTEMIGQAMQVGVGVGVGITGVWVRAGWG